MGGEISESSVLSSLRGICIHFIILYPLLNKMLFPLLKAKSQFCLFFLPYCYLHKLGSLVNNVPRIIPQIILFHYLAG